MELGYNQIPNLSGPYSTLEGELLDEEGVIGPQETKEEEPQQDEV